MRGIAPLQPKQPPAIAFLDLTGYTTLAEEARSHEVLVSDDAKRSPGGADVEFELVGDVPLKGVSKSVRPHRGYQLEPSRTLTGTARLAYMSIARFTHS